MCNVLLWPDCAILSVALCFFVSCQCSVPANLSLLFFSTFWCVSIIYSYGLKLFPSVFQQDFLINLFSCITMLSFLIHVLLKVLQLVVIRCFVAPSVTSSALGHGEHNIVSCCNMLLEPFRGFLCFCDEKGISNLAIVLIYQPDLCFERMRKTTTPAATFGHQT